MSNQYFSKAELTCNCGCCQSHMDDHFMMKLTQMRRETGVVMPINSAYRCPVYDDKMGGAGVHPTGRAVDIRLSGEAADLIITIAPQYGFSGRGIKQRGPFGKRFIHLDDLDNGDHPRPRTWTY